MEEKICHFNDEIVLESMHLFWWFGERSLTISRFLSTYHPTPVLRYVYKRKLEQIKGSE